MGYFCYTISMAKKLNTEEFIEKAKLVHQDIYIYKNTNYVGSKIKVSIECPIHGEFLQSPNNHLKGAGCPDCGKYKTRPKKTHKEFLEEARSIHGNLYTYTERYERDDKKISITCHTHGIFRQTPNKHLRGQGCPRCAKNYTLYKEEFISESRKVHGDFYDYSLVKESVSGLEDIVCPKHGLFRQYYYDHMSGHGCRKCYDSSRKKMDFHEFLEKHQRPGFSYEGFSGYFSPFLVTCLKHNHTFSITPHNHIKRTPGGCSFCAKVSQPHRVVLDMFPDENVIVNDRSMISPHELDIFFPERRFAVEVNGLYHHSKKDYKYHEMKFRKARDKGIDLVQFWDSEVYEKPDLIKSFIAHKIGLTRSKIYARKCVIKDISYTQYKSFLDLHHLEGGGIKSKERKGMFFKDELVSVMGFSGDELQRFASKSGFVVVGGFSRLLKSFGKSRIVTFSDNRYSNGDIYQKHGFRKVGVSKPRLFVTDHKNVYNRRSFQKKYLMNLKSYSEEKTAERILNEEGYFHLYSAATTKWIFDSV